MKTLNEAISIVCQNCTEGEEHCKDCPVTRIKQETEAEEYIECQIDLVHSITVRKYDNWHIGTIGNYFFEAKVTDEGSEFGIDNGRIIKLFIRTQPEGNPKGGEEIVAYERGWDKYPEDNPEYETLIDAIVFYFENHMDDEQKGGQANG